MILTLVFMLLATSIRCYGDDLNTCDAIRQIEHLSCHHKRSLERDDNSDSTLTSACAHDQEVCDLSRQLEHSLCYHGNHKYRDCADVQAHEEASPSGIYTIEPEDGKGSFPVLCDMATDGGGWLVVQKRFDGSQDFYQKWNVYKDGFGELNHEFWLGNEKMHRITKQKPYELRFDLEDFDNERVYEVYPNFKIAGEADNYRLGVGKGSGTAGDSFSKHSNAQFSAEDKDVDISSTNCAFAYHGAWWYTKCHASNLNGDYNNTAYAKGLTWQAWKGYYYSLKATEMKIRPME